MKTLLVSVALALVAIPSYAAVQYEFTQKNISTDSDSAASDLTARATVDGMRSKVEFLAGNVYPPGTYMISTDGSRNLYFVDPSRQWYTEVNTSTITSALSAGAVTIENVKTNVEQLPDSQVIAGIEAQHYRVTMTYDITLMMKSIPIKQHVQTEINRWTTTRFGQVHTSYLGVPNTGNAQLDEVMSVESKKVPGFPLRQQISIKTHYNLPVGSKLKTPTTRMITKETWVTAIREVPAANETFTFPATYRRADQPQLPKATTELNFEPAGSK